MTNLELIQFDHLRVHAEGLKIDWQQDYIDGRPLSSEITFQMHLPDKDEARRVGVFLKKKDAAA